MDLGRSFYQLGKNRNSYIFSLLHYCVQSDISIIKVEVSFYFTGRPGNILFTYLPIKLLYIMKCH